MTRHPEGEPPSRRSVEQIVQEVLYQSPGAAALFVGMLGSGGTTHDLAVGMGGGVAAAVTQAIVTTVRQLREERIAETMEAASSMSGMTLDDLLARVAADERTLELAATALDAAACVLEEHRRRALARTIVNGIADGDRVSLEERIGRALAVLDSAELQVLARLSHPNPGSTAAFTRWPVYSLALLQEALPGAREALDPIMAVLESHGLVFVKGSSHFAAREWVITDFGRLCLRRLQGEGLKLSRPADDLDAFKWKAWRDEQKRRREVDKQVREGTFRESQ